MVDDLLTRDLNLAQPCVELVELLGSRRVRRWRTGDNNLIDSGVRCIHACIRGVNNGMEANGERNDGDNDSYEGRDARHQVAAPDSVDCLHGLLGCRLTLSQPQFHSGHQPRN